jgi:hypothetical protein
MAAFNAVLMSEGGLMVTVQGPAIDGALYQLPAA